MVRSRQGDTRLELLRWGLVPEWSSDPGIGGRMINARAETIGMKPAFREPYRRSRCLVPIRAFYEWTGPRKRRRPVAIRSSDDRLLTLAGIWTQAHSTGESVLETFAIITKPAGAVIEAIHDRMPVIIREEERHAWLDQRDPGEGGPTSEDLHGILHRAGDDGLRIHPVSDRVNSPRHDDPGLLDEDQRSNDPGRDEAPGLFDGSMD